MNEETLRRCLAEFQNNIRKDTESTLKKELSNLWSSINENKEDIQGLRQENHHLKTQCESQQKLIDKLVKRNNLIIHGLDEIPNESNTQTLDKVMTMIRERLNISIDISSVDQIRRLGEVKLNGNARPILFGLNSNLLKNDILRKRAGLKGTNIYINVDLDKDILNKQYKCRPLIKILKSKGITIKIINDNIMANGKMFKIDAILEAKPEDIIERCKMTGLTEEANIIVSQEGSTAVNEDNLNLLKRKRGRPTGSSSKKKKNRKQDNGIMDNYLSKNATDSEQPSGEEIDNEEND